jgi:hypothetical protein
MPETSWRQSASPAFRLMIATSWLAPANWQEKQEQAIREAIGAGMDWMEYIRQVDRHRTPALSWAALKRVPGLVIPEPARQELQKRSDACRLQAMLHSIHLASLLKAFDRAGIPAMPIKGPILSLELYGDVGLRQSRDLDLMVTLEDLAKAQACLESMGWRQDAGWFPLSPRQWEQNLRMEHHLTFIDPQSECHLELHWRFIWQQPGLNKALWDRSISFCWQGCSSQAMNPIDQVLYLCCHGAEHAWSRAKWLGDLARVHAEGRVDWQAALEQASRTDQERALLTCLRLLHILHGLPVPRLQGSPWEQLSPFLVDSPLYALQKDRVPTDRDLTGVGALDLLPDQLRFIRYERQILPRKNWRDGLSELAYCREDFGVLRLPDRLFWAYAPLRPFLWVWRRVMRRGIANG